MVPLLLHSFSPAPQPVILHGDLWSGNAGYDETTCTPVIFDPASYYGHNEADLGITHMFGGTFFFFFVCAIIPKTGRRNMLCNSDENR